jgi:hypothetical protein
MDSNSVLSKTAKGLLEATGKTRALPRDMRALLKEMDGQVTAGEAQARTGKYPDAKLLEVMKVLVQGNFVREVGAAANDAAASPPPPVAESGLSSESAGEQAERAECDGPRGDTEHEHNPRSGDAGILARESHRQIAAARPPLLRQTINLSALVAAYLQYFYVDVYLQISSLPSITT